MKQQQHDINYEEDSEKKIWVPDGIWTQASHYLAV